MEKAMDCNGSTGKSFFDFFQANNTEMLWQIEAITKTPEINKLSGLSAKYHLLLL